MNRRSVRKLFLFLLCYLVVGGSVIVLFFSSFWPLRLEVGVSQISCCFSLIISCNSRYINILLDLSGVFTILGLQIP